MVKKILFISSALFGLLFFTMLGGCFADAGAQMDVVISNLELGNYAEAEAETKKLIVDFAGHPDLPDVLYQVANEYQGHQILEQAQKLYKYIVDNLPESEYVILSRVGIIMSDIGLGNNANAQAAIDKLILDFNDHPALPGEIYRIASYEYWGERRYEDARRLYKYIVDNLPESEYVILSWGGVIMSDIGLGNNANAQAAIDNLIADFSDNPLIARVIWETAQAYFDLKKYEKANELYQHVIDNWPQTEHAISSQMGMAEINILSLIESGNYTSAQAALDSLIADFYDHPDLLTMLHHIGNNYLDLEKYDYAVATYQMVIEIVPNSEQAADVQADVQGAIGWTYVERGLYDQAIIEFRKVPENYPVSGWASSGQYWVGQCYYKKGDFEQAMIEYRKVIDLYPYSKEAGYAERKIALIEGRREKTGCSPAQTEKQSKATEGSSGCGPSALVTLGYLLGINLNE